MFVLKRINWGELDPDSWESTQWALFNDGRVERIETYRWCGRNHNIFLSSVYRISRLKVLFVMTLLNIARRMKDVVVEAVDGEAFEFTYYKNNEIVWARKQSYIYGVIVLELIAYLFE